MQVTRQDISATKVKLIVTLGTAELDHARQQELQEQAKKVRVTGFRQGKAPLNLVEKQLDDQQFQATVINHAINDYYGKALNEEKLRTLGQPEVTVGKFVPFSQLEFTSEVDILPKITLGNYKKIKKAKPTVSVGSKDIDQVIDNLRSRTATKLTVERSAKNGDEVIIDFAGSDSKGQSVAGASGTDYSLELGSNSFIPGFEAGLIGSKPGDIKKLDLTFPKDYHANKLAGTKISFEVTVKEVKATELPAADDAFAASIGPFKTLTELKSDVKQQLLEQKTVEASNKIKDEIVEELVKKSKLTLPELLVNDQIATLEHDFKQNLTYRGITLAEYLKQEKFTDEAAWKAKELQPQAERRVSVGLVLAEVAELEMLVVSPQELADRIALHKQQYQQSADQFDQPEMRREITSRIITEKTVDFLYNQAIAK